MSHGQWVSNLLGSPASGEYFFHASFQLIGWPTTWGGKEKAPPKSRAALLIDWVPQRVGRPRGRINSAPEPVSNLLGSPGSGETPFTSTRVQRKLSFQFIGFPSKWGDRKNVRAPLLIDFLMDW